MTHQTVTPEPHKDMPRQQGLLRRGGRFYTNFKVPKDLKVVVGKEHIREALKTSDYREACRKITWERSRWQAFFDAERRKLQEKALPERPERLLVTITEQEAYEIAARYLAELELKFSGWWEKNRGELDRVDLDEMKETVAVDLEAYEGGSKDYQPEDGAFDVKNYLKSHGIKCSPSSPAFDVLKRWFRAVMVEHFSRKLDVLGNRVAEVHNPQFKEAFAHTVNASEKPGATVAELVTRYVKTLRDAGRSEATLRTYEMPCRVLREGLGGDFLLSGIDQDCMEKLADLLRKLPVNSAQRYPKLTLPKAIEAADKAQDARRLNPRTQANYFTVLGGILNFAVEKRMMAENPAKDRWLKQTFGKPVHKVREQFSVDDLNKLFRAPLYTGCVNDERGFAKPGSNRPRRGRFWVPLLALFQGLRSNEACQLHIADVKRRHGIDILAIQEEAEEGGESDKHLKTTRSRRDVPLHPELIRIGFLDFVEERRKANDSQRLFPELPSGAKGYYSHVFSKWFPRFVAHALGEESEASLHSFRHTFRDATRAAKLSAESVALLGGWQGGEGNPALVMNEYGRGPEFLRMLKRDLAKVKYKGLDLSHLYRN